AFPRAASTAALIASRTFGSGLSSAALRSSGFSVTPSESTVTGPTSWARARIVSGPIAPTPFGVLPAGRSGVMASRSARLDAGPVAPGRRVGHDAPRAGSDADEHTP